MYEIGDKITFTPAAVFAADNGQESSHIRNKRNLVTGVVVAVNKAHRWFRVEYKPLYDSEQHECFKF